MPAILEARVIIAAEDRTARVFAAIEARLARLGGMVRGFDAATGYGRSSPRFARSDPFATMEIAVNRLTRAIERMDASISLMARSTATRAVSRSPAGAAALSPVVEGGRRTGGGRGLGFAGGHLLGFGAGFAAIGAAHEAVATSAERGHEQSRMSLAGMSPSEINEATLAAADLSAKAPTISQNDLMHMLRNARSVVGGYKEAAEIMEPLAKLRVLAQAAHPGKDVSEDFDQLIKGLEIKGVTQNPKMFKEYMNGIAKGLNTFGDTLRANDYYQMMLYGRPATPGLEIWRDMIEARVSLREAHRCIKIWRAFWNVAIAMGYCRGYPDPSKAIINRAAAARQAVWREGEVTRLAKGAWRMGYRGLAAVIAISWDTQLSPVDVRALTAGQAHRDVVGAAFTLARAKTGRAAFGTISKRSERLLAAYMNMLGAELLKDAPIFRNRSGRAYSKDTLGDDFRDVRAAIFGPAEKRTLADFRRSGTVEALDGGADAETISAKMANTLSASNSLFQAYAPVQIGKVRDADKARRKGRSKSRIESGQ